MAAIVAVEIFVTVFYLFLLRTAVGFAIFVFWALGFCMVVHLARDALFTRPSPLAVVKNEIRREFDGT
jgi:hypothetical protein